MFLICVQGSFRQGITDFDYAHVLGTAIEGTATEESGAEALGASRPAPPQRAGACAPPRLPSVTILERVGEVYNAKR